MVLVKLVIKIIIYLKIVTKKSYKYIEDKNKKKYKKLEIINFQVVFQKILIIIKKFVYQIIK